MTATKAAVGALLGGLGGATLSILGKAFFTRSRNPEAFDAVTTGGVLLGAVFGSAIADTVAPDASTSTAMTAPATTPTA